MIPRTRFVISSIALAAGVAIVAGNSRDREFRAGTAAEYAHQSSDQVTIGAKAFDSEELTAEAFGKKADLLRYGVLPVLVVIENKREKTLDLRELEVNLVAADGRHVSAINPEDVPYLGRTGRRASQVPLPVPLPKKKNPLNAPEIVTRAFAAKILPPGDSASGFFYFEARREAGDKIYLNGLRDARSGQEILYFEFGF
ncbi:MAG: hypothetical protein JO145_01340 [Acidobacteriaceae bacterium]|nr:hypothetical protein [Acidobacteriaceae bacterium]MBV9763496.1 hypothetical protein [Acidobacteriaceae bacterium]